MEETPGIFIQSNQYYITGKILRESYEKATKYLKTRDSFVFSNPNYDPEHWSILNWSKNVERFMILSKGNESDISALPPTHMNNIHIPQK